MTMTSRGEMEAYRWWWPLSEAFWWPRCVACGDTEDFCRCPEFHAPASARSARPDEERAETVNPMLPIGRWRAQLAEQIRAAVAEEREACAKVANAFYDAHDDWLTVEMAHAAADIAAAIRARGAA